MKSIRKIILTTLFCFLVACIPLSQKQITKDQIQQKELSYKEIIEKFYMDRLGPKGDSIQSWKDGVNKEIFALLNDCTVRYQSL